MEPKKRPAVYCKRLYLTVQSFLDHERSSVLWLNLVERTRSCDYYSDLRPLREEIHEYINGIDKGTIERTMRGQETERDERILYNARAHFYTQAKQEFKRSNSHWTNIKYSCNNLVNI